MSELDIEWVNWLINDLPNEVLLEVFNYFSGKELKTLSLVCKTWSEIIFRSSSTMQHLPLDFFRYTRDEEKFPLNRNYHSVKLQHIQPDIDEEFNAIAEHIQNLEISHISFNSSEQFSRIFSSLRSLKKLTLIRIQVSFDVSSDILDKRLSVDDLILIQVDQKILQFLTKLEILHMEVTDASAIENPKALTFFLKNQKKLEHLTIEKLSDGTSALFSTDFKSFNTNLKMFSILHSQVLEIELFEKNFIQFLLPHELSLEKLKVEGCATHQIFKTIVTNFIFLNELEMRASELPQIKSFFDFLQPNKSLKILKLNGTIQKSNLQGFLGCLLCFPRVEKMYLADSDDFVANDVYNSMSVKLLNLQHLSVLNFSKSFIGRVNFPRLKVFSIRILNDINQWKTFVIENHSIESLNVGWIKRDQFTSQVIEEIINLPNLRDLHFGGRFIASKKIYDVIKQDYRNLRTLKFTVANYEEIKKLKFTFPLDKSLWFPKCQYFDEGHDREPLND